MTFRPREPFMAELRPSFITRAHRRHPEERPLGRVSKDGCSAAVLAAHPSRLAAKSGEHLRMTDRVE
jgi:hypothetical protein